MKIKLFVFLLIFSSFLNINLPSPSYAQIKELREKRIKRELTYQNNEYREKRMLVSEVVKRLDIKTAMKILDVGAGDGLFTIAFAEALNGTGKVYATDTDKGSIGYLQSLANKRSYKNVYPVLVSPDATDEFYQSHKFDIIFACYLYYYLPDPQKFFSDLLPSLNKDGSVFIINPSPLVYFQEAFFVMNNYEKLITDLKRPDNIEIFKRFSKTTQKQLLKAGDNEIEKTLWQNLINGFNTMLNDRTIYPSLMKFYCKDNEYHKYSALEKISKRNATLMLWLAENLENDGVFSSNKPLSSLNKERLNRLNSLLITGSLQSDLLALMPPYYIAKKNEIIRTLESAGYQFIEEYNIAYYYYFLKFQKTK